MLGFLDMCPIGLILYVKSYTHVTLYLRILKDFLHLKFQEFLMFSTSANFGDGIFPKWHLMFSRSININFNPDRLGVLCLTKKSMLKQLHKLTNCGKYRGLSNWLWMQGNCLVFGNSEKKSQTGFRCLSVTVLSFISSSSCSNFWERMFVSGSDNTMYNTQHQSLQKHCHS